MSKKILAFTACLALIGVLFTGCWWNNDDSSSSSSYSSSSSSMLSGSSSGSMSGGSSSMGDSSMGDNSMGGSSSMSDNTMGGSSSSMASSSSMQSSSASTVANASVDFLSWQLRVANAKNPLPDGFTVKCRKIEGYDSRLFDERAADSLEKMLTDAEKAGLKLYLVSGYRSVSRQKALFERKTNYYIDQGLVREKAEEEAAKWVARPGTSEHNLGLAADIVSADWYSQHNDLTADFEETEHFKWLKTNCAQYGFIIRYPKDKQEITGITYEPWHYRYVGQEAAKIIMEQGLCLEEYTKKA